MNYTYEQRKKAIELYIRYDFNVAAVIRELGYPSRNMIYVWYKEYKESGDLKPDSDKRKKYTKEQRTAAVEYYMTHGQSISKTISALGYPKKTLLNEWVNEDIPRSKQKRYCKTGGVLLRYSLEEKEEAVKDYCTGAKTASQISKEYKISYNTVKLWRKQLLLEESKLMTPKKFSEDISSMTFSELQEEKKKLEAEIFQLRLERDILEKAAEIIKKDQGISLQKLKNQEKAVLIDALRPKYRLKTLLQALNMSKSSYCYQHNKIQKPDKYASLRIHVKEAFEEGRHTYGYRRIYLSLKKSGIVVSEKVIRKIMKQDNLMVSVIKKRKYNSYKGEITPAVDNVINRNFHADYPNKVWLTDITEFHIPAGKVYLSPIIDCFDGLPVAWSIGTSPDARLVNTMLDEAIQTLNENEHPIVHSDRGAHYRWPGWIERMDAAELTRSMSKKGCSPDNAACEGFFGRIKNEMFYNRSWTEISIESFIEQLNDYIQWYATKRIKASLHGMSPLEYRANLGLVS